MSELDDLIKANQQATKATPKPKKQTRQDRLMEILTKFHEAYDDLDGLASEVEDSVSAQEDTNLCNTERFQRLQEASKKQARR